MLSNPKDITQGSSTGFRDMVSDGTYLHVCTSQSRYKKYNIQTTQQVNTDLTILSGAACISMIAAASVVIGSSTSSSVDIVDINTYARTNFTTNAGTVNKATGGQQMAGFISQGVVMSTRGTNSTIQKIASNGTITQLTPSAISGVRVHTITTTSEASGTWLCGTSDGKVHEFNASGTVLKSITLPTDAYVNTPAIIVTGLSFYNDRLLVMNNHGITYLYRYSDSTLLEKGFGCLEVSNAISSSLCHSASNTTITTPCIGTNNAAATYELFFRDQMMVEDSYMNISASQWYGGAIDPITNKAFINSANTSSFESLRILDISPTRKINVSTKAQNPPGNNVTARIIRIRDGGVGKAVIESDTNIAAAETDIVSTEGRNYIELALISDAGSKYDIREFKA